MKKYIGIIGGNGTVGKNVIETLYMLKLTKEDILIGIRKTEYSAHKQTDNIMKLNINDNEQLKLFCSKCSTIIDCIGPSSIIENKIAKVCLETKTNYIEVSGDDVLSENISMLKNSFLNEKINGVYCAGVNPGLVEALTNFYLMKYNPSFIEVYFSGSGSISFNAAVDMIVSCKSGSMGMTFIENGMVRKIKRFKYNNMLPEPTGRVLCVPVINKYFARCVQNQKVEEAYFYNSFKSENIITTMAAAKNEALKSRIDNLAKELQYEFEKEKELYGKEFTAIYVYMKKEKMISKKMIYYGSWNELTGVIAAITAIGIERKQFKICGVGEIWETIEADWFIQNLRQIGRLEMDL